MGNFLINPVLNLMKLGCVASATVTGLALDSAPTFGSSGDFIAFTYVSRESSTLTDFYFYVTAVAGTLGNIQVKVDLRDDSSGAPGSTIHATVTVGVNGAATWARATFASPYTLTAGTTYHITLSNASGAPTTDFPTVARISSRFPILDSNDLTGRQSTNGGSTWVGGTSSMMVGVWKFGNGNVIGNPYNATNSNYTSNSRERGLYIETRDVGLNLFELRAGAGTNVSGAKLLKSSTGSNGESPGAGEYSGTWVSGQKSAKFAADAIALPNQAYRLVLTFSGNSTSPAYTTIVDYARFADVQACALCNGKIYGTIADGSGGWTDSPDVLPMLELWTRGVSAEAASGGGVQPVSGPVFISH